MRELSIPGAVQRDQKSVEMIRVWVAEGSQWTSLNTDLFKDRKFEETWAWGMFLADTVRHLANAMTAENGGDKTQVMKQILDAMNEELDKPTTDIKGGFDD